MILCFYCDIETKRQMDDLIAKGHHSDYSELVSVAISTQWLLEQEIGESGGIIIGESVSREAGVVRQAKKTSNTVNPASRSATLKDQQSLKPVEKEMAASQPRIPNLFMSEGITALSVPTLEGSWVDTEGTENFTLDRWLFGQYNKLLPAKANCRALARLAAQYSEGPQLDETASRIAEAAALLGDYLADHDRRHRVGRDDALATAFPRSGPDDAKSRSRYANQFVGAVNSQGQFSGLLWDYRFAALAATNPASLQLTAHGLGFARLGNPVLDQSQNDPAQKFSREETAYLLEHIQRFIPVESFAFRTLIAAIQEGADTPEKLDEALRIHVPADSNRSLSPSFLTSQRSGALSRMADLGLIARVRKGVKVSYHVTEGGIDFNASRLTQTQKENA